MSILDTLLPYRWAAVGAIVVSLGTLAGYERIKAANAEAGTATCKADLASQKEARQKDRADAAAAAASQSEAYRAEEQRRIAAQQEVTDEAERKLVKARADAAIADAAAGRLQQRVSALVAAARVAASNPAAPASGAAAPDPLDLLADMQRRVGEAAGQFAVIADQRGAAGQACVASYDALTRTAHPAAAPASEAM